MSLSIEELESETVEFLPAREVMSTCGRRNRCCGHGGGDDNDGVDQDYNGGGGINILSGNQVGISVFNVNG